jgi:hypothetical protein
MTAGDTSLTRCSSNITQCTGQPSHMASSHQPAQFVTVTPTHPGDAPPLSRAGKLDARRKMRGLLNSLVFTALTQEEFDVLFGPDGSLAVQAGLSEAQKKWLRWRARTSNIVYISHATFVSLSRCAREDCRGEWNPRRRKSLNTCVVSRRLQISKTNVRRLQAGRRAFIELSSSEDMVPWPPMDEVKEQVGEQRFADERAKFKRLVCQDCVTRVANKRQRQEGDRHFWPSGPLARMPYLPPDSGHP